MKLYYTAELPGRSITRRQTRQRARGCHRNTSTKKNLTDISPKVARQEANPGTAIYVHSSEVCTHSHTPTEIPSILIHNPKHEDDALEADNEASHPRHARPEKKRTGYDTPSAAPRRRNPNVGKSRPSPAGNRHATRTNVAQEI